MIYLGGVTTDTLLCAIHYPINKNDLLGFLLGMYKLIQTL